VKPTEKRPRGAVPGVRKPRTPARTAANRVRALTHGRRAQVVTVTDAYRVRYEESHPDAVSVLHSFKRGILDGDTSGVADLSVLAMTQTELLRRECVDAIAKDGVIVEDAIFGVDEHGKTVMIGHRKTDNPALRHVHKFSETLGFTAEHLLLSKKARGEQATNALAAAALARDAMLRSADKSRIPLSPAALLAAKK
jgi:hypothetical protein